LFSADFSPGHFLNELPLIRAPTYNSDFGRDAMKLCPQCDFIYEDDQRFCDMDGKELVQGAAPMVNEATVATSAAPTTEHLAEPQSRGVAAAVVVVVVLTALVVVLYLVRARQTRSGAASEASTQLPDRSAGQSPVQSTSENTEARPSGSDLASTETLVANSEQSPEVSADSSSQIETASASQSPTLKASLAHTRLAASPVSAGAAAGNNRGSVIVRLNNGASIKADEAWEKKEGVWYRQAGMVTFVKRSSVRSIDRVAPPVAESKPVAKSPGDKNKKNPAAQNQLRLARLEPVETKKPSRFSSFLKKTGRVLKKPFKM
jgi:hypothetical protein